MDIPKIITLFNTGKKIKNEFFILETPGKNTQNSFDKDVKIQNYGIFYNLVHSIYLPNFIRNSLPTILLETEAILETHRQKYHPDFPSRFACLFVFDNLQDVLKYQDDCHKGKNYNIYKIQVASSCYKVTQHNMEYISMLRTTYGFPIFHTIVEEENLLERYWIGEAKIIDYSKYGSNNGIFHPTFEYLIEGKFTKTLYTVD